ncbi:hypothetical protein T310_0904 [Rasamsonia emersonii CBS 393.64]|uniref:Uncharacterized protein n=1 Tax=Rasamsonia emersonii (strain ATCC 16479 / CBS 393.64 / IMI 116815) TaxID=1408163 RepID=A0A0F4Z3D8_RASE3|nr:hypothetical protein T310_0904 [Rasamsonia emersonii CBS 393.64]KKA25039.1 hypothetical protein T310_0904 [Rasamsonia emersonii CBS 393.64]
MFYLSRSLSSSITDPMIPPPCMYLGSQSVAWSGVPILDRCASRPGPGGKPHELQWVTARETERSGAQSWPEPQGATKRTTSIIWEVESAMGGDSTRTWSSSAVSGKRSGRQITWYDNGSAVPKPVGDLCDQTRINYTSPGDKIRRLGAVSVIPARRLLESLSRPEKGKRAAPGFWWIHPRPGRTVCRWAGCEDAIPGAHAGKEQSRTAGGRDEEETGRILGEHSQNTQARMRVVVRSDRGSVAAVPPAGKERAKQRANETKHRPSRPSSRSRSMPSDCLACQSTCLPSSRSPALLHCLPPPSPPRRASSVHARPSPVDRVSLRSHCP